MLRSVVGNQRAPRSHRRAFHHASVVYRQKPPSGNGSNNKSGSGAASSGTPGDKKKKASAKGQQDEPGLSKSLNQLQKALSVVDSMGKQGSLLGRAGNNFPEVVVLPVSQRPFFPGFYKAIHLHDQQMIRAVKQTLKDNKPYVGVFLTTAKASNRNAAKPAVPSSEVITIQSPDSIYKTGVFAQIYNMIAGPNDSVTLFLFPHHRVKIRELKIHTAAAASPAATKPLAPATIDEDAVAEDAGKDATLSRSKEDQDVAPVRAVVEALHASPFDSKAKEYRKKVKALLDTITKISQLNPLVRDQMAEFMRAVGTVNDLYESPEQLADIAADLSDSDPHELQQVLECVDIEERLDRSLMLLKRELLNAELQSRVSKDLETRVGDRDREYFLRERLRVIQAELGMESDSREKLMEKYRKRTSNLLMPEMARKVFDEEMGKLAHLRPSSQEYNLTTTYLDWLTQVPWGIRPEENFEIQHAQTVLDEDHFGLKDVKERILEFIAVGKLRGTVQGKIICLVGPPGVGKTSIGKSIARALNRRFYRFSVGGLYDVAEVKGHRRTYVGAMPGKLIQALKTVHSENPLILIDEIDKIGRGGHSGDPSSALLEVLDPEQNSSFLDHYLDIPVDLSNVLFVCTANVTDTIPGPLLDRMEIISLAGYVQEEKEQIAQTYLVPQSLEATGLNTNQVRFEKQTISDLLQYYCRESGVRNLKKQIEKICRKVALKFVQDDSGLDNQRPEIIEPSSLREYLGNPVFVRDRLYERTPEGVIMGLAFNSMGGSALYIESVRSSMNASDGGTSGPSGILPTGNIGSVMKESTDIAYSYARSLLRQRDPDNTFFETVSVHLHVPEGATPKDGPSAGIAMCSSLISLALDRPVALDVALTGELTLTGRVLKIGGVKEKMMAAKRSHVQHVILPAANRPDFEDLEPYIREGLKAHFVESYEQVFDLLFPQQLQTQ